MTDGKARTAGDVLELLRHADGDGLFAQHCEVLLESWRRELLSGGWTYLPGKMPAEDYRVELAVERADDGRRTIQPGSLNEHGVWVNDNLWPIFDRVYAWRPLPEPPPVPKGGQGDG